MTGQMDDCSCGRAHFCESEVLAALIMIDRMGQERYSRSERPLAGTGGGYLGEAVGLRDASNVLRLMLGMPRNPGYRSEAAS